MSAHTIYMNAQGVRVKGWMNLRAGEITDPILLVNRIRYRNERMKTRLHKAPNVDNLIGILSGHNNTDLNRLEELLEELL